MAIFKDFGDKLIKALERNAKAQEFENKQARLRSKGRGAEADARAGALGRANALADKKGRVRAMAGFAQSISSGIGRAAGVGARGAMAAGAAATDPRDVSGVGTSRALQGIMAGLVGQQGAAMISNVGGLTNTIEKQSNIQSSVETLIQSRAQGGQSTPREMISRAVSHQENVTKLIQEGRAVAEDVIGKKHGSEGTQEFTVLTQMDQAIKGTTSWIEKWGAEIMKVLNAPLL